MENEMKINIIILIILNICAGCAETAKLKKESGQPPASLHSASTSKDTLWDRSSIRPNHLALAKDLIASNHYDVAFSQLATAIKKQAENPEILYLMGVCCRHKKDYETACEYFIQALDLNPDFAPAHNGLGITYTLKGKTKMAEKSFLHAISIDPAKADFYNNLGFLEMIIGRYADAKIHFAKSLILAPTSKKANNNLAFCLAITGEEKSAFQLLQKTGSPATAFNNMGTIYKIKGEDEKAFHAFKKAEELDSDITRPQNK